MRTYSFFFLIFQSLLHFALCTAWSGDNWSLRSRSGQDTFVDAQMRSDNDLLLQWTSQLKFRLHSFLLSTFTKVLHGIHGISAICNTRLVPKRTVRHAMVQINENSLQSSLFNARREKTVSGGPFDPRTLNLFYAVHLLLWLQISIGAPSKYLFIQTT